MTARTAAVRLLDTLTDTELARESSDRRFPKWATMCLLRRLGLKTLNGCHITPNQGTTAIPAAIAQFRAATGSDRVMLRSDGGSETRRYYRGGNTFPIGADLRRRAELLLNQGRVILLLEPTNRFSNRLSVLIRLDRAGRHQPGQIDLEALGPGYDVADLTRGGIAPQVRLSVTDVDWAHYREPWWWDLKLTSDLSVVSENRRRNQRLRRLATSILTDTGQLAAAGRHLDPAAAAEHWLRRNNHDELWHEHDIVGAVARRAHRWIEDAYLLAVCHPNRSWTCLATSLSDLGHGRWVFWDVIDGAHKYGPQIPDGSHERRRAA